MHQTFGVLLTQKSTMGYAQQIASLCGSTYRYESVFSDMNFIKNKLVTLLTDAHQEDSLQSCSVMLHTRGQVTHQSTIR